jgi:hypothetical protein
MSIDKVRPSTRGGERRWGVPLLARRRGGDGATLRLPRTDGVAGLGRQLGPHRRATARERRMRLHRLAGATNIAAALRHHARDAAITPATPSGLCRPPGATHFLQSVGVSETTLVEDEGADGRGGPEAAVRTVGRPASSAPHETRRARRRPRGSSSCRGTDLHGRARGQGHTEDPHHRWRRVVLHSGRAPRSPPCLASIRRFTTRRSRASPLPAR